MEMAAKTWTGEWWKWGGGTAWDYTATQHIMLADLVIDGELRKVLMQAPKNGFFYVLDRVTGELLSAEKFGVVNWASHVDMATGRPVETPEARVFDGKNISLPSNAGAHNWPPMAWNPDAGLVYIPTLVFPVTFLAPSEEKDMLPGQGKWNVGFAAEGGPVARDWGIKNAPRDGEFYRICQHRRCGGDPPVCAV